LRQKEGNEARDVFCSPSAPVFGVLTRRDEKEQAIANFLLSLALSLVPLCRPRITPTSRQEFNAKNATETKNRLKINSSTNFFPELRKTN